ncbi:MAG: hypothetical protein LDL16_05615, partial [Thiobacillus sp.]|nr:hypothetical protein [Thiobacillus sp.]
DDLRAALRRDSPQRVRLHAEAARDSDALFTRTLAVEAGLALGDRQSLEASVRQAWLSQRHARLDGRQAMLGVGARFGEAGAPGGLVFPSLQLGGWDYDGWQHAAWRARLKWLPADGWRWDFEAGNTPIENIDAIRSRVRFDYLSAGFDHRFAPRWQMSLGALGGRFDDGNQRLRLSGRLETRLGEHPRLTLGVEGMGFADSRPPSPGRGYWSPDRYRELKLAATVEHDYAGWNLYLKGAAGRLWETPGARTPLYLVEAAARHPLGDWGELRVYAGYSDSAAWSQSSGGYWRGYYGLTFNVPF